MPDELQGGGGGSDRPIVTAENGNLPQVANRRDPALQDLLFEEPAPVDVRPVPVDLSSPWPSWMPSLENSLAVLAGEAVLPPPLQAFTDENRAGLSDLELAELRSESADAATLDWRAVALTRWRLGLAISALPQPPPQVDAPSLDALLAEADAAMAAVQRLSESATDEARAVLDAARAALARDAVALSELIRAEAPRPTDAPAPVRRNSTPTARIVSVATVPQEVTNKRRRRDVAVWAVFGVSVLLAGAYHGQRLLKKPPVAGVTVPGAPEGTHAVQIGSDQQIVRASGDLDPNQVESFKRQVEASGKTIQEIAPGEFLIRPNESPNPSR